MNEICSFKIPLLLQLNFKTKNYQSKYLLKSTIRNHFIENLV